MLKSTKDLILSVFRSYKKEYPLTEHVLLNIETVERMLKIEPIVEEILIKPNTYENLTTEELIKQIRNHNQVQIYTVYEEWCIQLFDLNVCPNDIGASCNWEDSDKDLKKVLIRALEYIVED